MDLHYLHLGRCPNMPYLKRRFSLKRILTDRVCLFSLGKTTNIRKRPAMYANLNRGTSAVPTNVKPRRVLFETYEGGHFEMSRCQFQNGILGLLVSEQSFMDRSVREDTALKFLGGMISKDTRNRPAWQETMMKALPESSTLAYVGPGSPDNKTMMTIPNGVDYNSCPGIWCLQFASPAPENTNLQFVLSWRMQF